jgi:hypothetical protein
MHKERSHKENNDIALKKVDRWEWVDLLVNKYLGKHIVSGLKPDWFYNMIAGTGSIEK